MQSETINAFNKSNIRNQDIIETNTQFKTFLHFY